MAVANKLKSVFVAMHDRVVATGSSLRLAINEGILQGGDDLSQAPDRYWSERIEGQSQGSTQFRGSRGGLVWRYLLAAASWECLLGRASILFGSEARRIVQQMGRVDANDTVVAGKNLETMLSAALCARGFQAYLIERFGSDRTLQSVSRRIEEWRASPAIEDVSSIIDFILDVFVQEAELADVCNLPRNLEADRSEERAPWLLEATDEWHSTQLGETGLRAATETLWDRRGRMRAAVNRVLDKHDALRGLVLSRFLPYAESRFQVVEAHWHPSREPWRESLPISIVVSDCEERHRRDLRHHSEIILQESGALIPGKRISEVLTRCSVPFLYWCAKAHIDIRPLWGDEFRSIELWPLGRLWAHQETCIAIASRLDSKSFVRALRELLRVRQEGSHTTCVLVTDQWDEERATAEYQASGVGQHDRGIVVCRSDGPQRPMSVFRFPA